MTTIRQRVEAAGITQTALAAELGLSQPSVSDRMTGRTRWQIDELRTVARLTGCSVAELIEEAA